MFPIVEKLGGWPAVEALLAEGGVNVTAHARKKWQAAGRERLPRNVVAVLAAAASKNSIRLEASDFDFQREDGARSRRASNLSVSAKGEVLLGKDIVEHLGAASGGEIVVDKLPDGSVALKASPRGDFSAFFKALKPKKGVKLSIDDIAEISARGWAGER